MTYHLHPRTGEISKCDAKKRSWPLGGEHFESGADAFYASEVKRKLELTKTATVWLLALAVAVFIVKGTSIGRVLLVVSEKRGYGVHVGDSLAIIPLLVAALWTHRARITS